MNPDVDDRLQRLLGGDALAALRQRLRRRFENGAPGEAPGSLRLNDLAQAERAALAGLLGRPPRNGSSMLVDVASIDAALRRAGLAESLRDALERLDGRIVDRAAERERRQAQWARVREAAGHAALAQLLSSPAGLGLLKRLSASEPDAAAALLARAAAVLRRLPAHGVTRSALAAEALGDAHALDAGRPVATLVLGAARAAFSTDPVLADAVTDAESAAAAVRDAWAALGVLVNELARPALHLNLPSGMADDSAAPPGEPAYLSLRRLLRSPPQWDVRGRMVYVCENPNLLAIAADRLGALCAPLVCTDGMPSAAQRTLLQQLTTAGARLRYHGDFDWAGLRIGNWVMRAFDAQPWCYGCDDYLAAALHAHRPGRLLDGPAVEAAWDPALATAMRRENLALDEEALAPHLLVQLAGR